ncbi:hypothetical protein [Chloroherpeton thalassium]|uniref:hypothetical protein n=1 Tax=Chloroherpeton thalassium TaxID=100716 RepID=UPI0012FC26B1|nr:hypothetical protein [Chloroherpeton thalassium]
MAESSRACGKVARKSDGGGVEKALLEKRQIPIRKKTGNPLKSKNLCGLFK